MKKNGLCLTAHSLTSALTLAYTRKEYAGGAPLRCRDPSAVPLAGEGGQGGVLLSETPLRFFRQFEVERLHVHHQACVLYGQDDCILV